MDKDIEKLILLAGLSAVISSEKEIYNSDTNIKSIQSAKMQSVFDLDIRFANILSLILCILCILRSEFL